MNRRIIGGILPGLAALAGSWMLLALAGGVPARGQAAATEATTPDSAAVKVCTSCHSMQIVMDTPKDYDDWHETVQKMIDRGARGTPEEFDLVMDFLFQNMTPIDVNHADPESLMAILRASQQSADAIMARRTVRPFKDLADLESAVPGLDKAHLEGKKRMIFFQ